MPIIRATHDEKYFTVLNDPFNNDDLSFAARGLLAYILSKPDNWVLNNQDLYKRSPAKKTAINNMLKELKAHGYMNRYRVNVDGEIKWVTDVYEDRAQNPDWKDEGSHYPKERSLNDRKPDHRGNGSSPNPKIINPSHIINTETEQITEKTLNTTTTAQAPTHDAIDDGADLDFSSRSSHPDFATVSKAYEREIGVLSSTISDKIKAELDDIDEVLSTKLPDASETSADWILYAIEAAVLSNARNWFFIQGTLDNIRQSGSLAQHKINWGNSKAKRRQAKANIKPIGANGHATRSSQYQYFDEMPEFQQIHGRVS